MVHQTYSRKGSSREKKGGHCSKKQTKFGKRGKEERTRLQLLHGWGRGIEAVDASKGEKEDE